ncbi:polysaccharide deacetylase family protein [bacterium]|nr:polysaccharide deacetylase family protein [bacterium]
MKPKGVERIQRSPYYFLEKLGILDALIARKIVEGRLPLYILSYHRFSPRKRIIRSTPPCIDINSFREQIEFLCRNFEVIPLSIIAHCIHKREPFPKNSVAITIDDGYKDNYLLAYPILKENKVPATIFLTTSYIDGKQTPWEAKVSFAISHTSIKELSLEGIGRFNLRGEKRRYIAREMIIKRLKKVSEKRKKVLIEKLIKRCDVEIPPCLGKELMLSWNEIREMNGEGIEFGAHTVHHPELTNIPLTEAKWEIEESKRELEEGLGKQVFAFAYPSGIYNKGIVRLVKNAGFLCAVTTSLREVKPWSNPYELGRAIGIDEDFSKFKAIVSGIYERINTCWGLLR